MSWAKKYPDQRLVDYDPGWPGEYLNLERSLTAALGTDWAMELAGSTAVPGMRAKPVIDVVMRACGLSALARTRLHRHGGRHARCVLLVIERRGN